MSSRVVFRIVLSLLLLLSQQMAFTHALSHWSANEGRAKVSVTAHTSGDSEAYKNALADHSCDQCLAFAQLAGTLSNTPRWFAIDAVGAEAVAGCVSRPAHARTTCVFRSRAPPVFA